MRAQRVKLNTDLTRYDHRLVMGSLGWTLPEARAQWGVLVRYDCGATLDTLWRSLEVDETETKARELESLTTEFEHACIKLLRSGVSAAELRKLITTVAKNRKEPA